MKQYQKLIETIYFNGVKTGDRTGTGTIALPSYEYTCQLQERNGVIENFPLLTTKKVSLKSVFEELIWKLNGDTNIRYLIEHKNHIWTEWPLRKWLIANGQKEIVDTMWKDDEKTENSDEWKQAKKEFEKLILENDDFCKKWGELGHTYGYQFRHFGEVRLKDLNEPLRSQLIAGGGDEDTILVTGKDQLFDAVDKIRNNPQSRRIIITLWNPNDEDESRSLLPPCPFLYQFFANEDGMLHLKMCQRSCDTFLGVPYNTAQDALFLCMMAHITGRKPGKFIHSFGDAHIYLNHIKQIREQLTRQPYRLPSIKLNPEVKEILDFKWEDIELIDYEHHEIIRGAVSV